MVWGNRWGGGIQRGKKDGGRKWKKCRWDLYVYQYVYVFCELVVRKFRHLPRSPLLAPGYTFQNGVYIRINLRFMRDQKRGFLSLRDLITKFRFDGFSHFQQSRCSPPPPFVSYLSEKSWFANMYVSPVSGTLAIPSEWVQSTVESSPTFMKNYLMLFLLR